MTTQFERLIEMGDVHIFDVDHTLTSHSTGRRFVQAGYRAGVFTLAHIATLPHFYLRYRLGMLDIKDITQEIKGLTGRSRTEIDAICRAAWERYIHNDIYPAAHEYLRECRKRNKTVFLASASFDVILRPLAAHVGADEVISSILEFSGDRATGWLEGGPCYGDVKARRIEAALEKHGLTRQRSVFYSDSFHDLPSLRLAGSAVVVYPDTLLRRTARRNGWPVVKWNR